MIKDAIGTGKRGRRKYRQKNICTRDVKTFPRWGQEL
jgi:hypothetical protein